MNQFVAILRRLHAATAILAAVAVLSGLTPMLARAQADTKPAEPAPVAPSDSTAAASKEVDKQAKLAQPAKSSTKAAKVPKAPKTRKVAKPEKASVVTSPKAQQAPKAPKASKTKEPEKSWEEQKKEDGVYAKRSNWLSLRFGYAKRSGDRAGDGLLGYGIGYQRMISRKYAFAAGVGHDIVGHLGSQLDEAVPFTAEFQHHYNWKTAMRPYIGIGGGFYLRKYYRTLGEYNTWTSGGPHVSVGFTSALDANHVIGFDARVARVKGREGIVNPTFGVGKAGETIWTAKISWALVY